MNLLKSKMIERREEEIVKFLLKKSVKQLQRHKRDSNKDLMSQFYDRYFKDMDRKAFDQLFVSTKEYDNKRQGGQAYQDQ